MYPREFAKSAGVPFYGQPANDANMRGPGIVIIDSICPINFLS